MFTLYMKIHENALEIVQKCVDRVDLQKKIS